MESPISSDHILQLSPHGVLVLRHEKTSIQDVIVQANPAFCQMTGWDEESILQKKVSELGREQDTIWSKLIHVLNNKEDATFPCLHPRTNLWSEWNVVFKGVDTFIYLTDITKVVEKNTVQEQLQGDLRLEQQRSSEAVQFQDLVIEKIPNYFFVKDKDFKLILINQAFYTFYPKDKHDKIIGYTTLEDYDPQEAKEFLAEDMKAFETGYAEKEETITFPDGKTRTLFTKKTRFFNSKGEAFLLGVSTDITHLKHIQKELAEKNKDLNNAFAEANELKEVAETSSQYKSDFLANMSHELRTPMNGILGMGKAFDLTNLNDEQKQCLNIMMANAESLLNMINDILDLSKIESGKIVMEQIDFSLKDTLQTCYPILDVKAKEKSLPLTFHIDPAVPGFMNGDPGRLRQVILNLVGNAIKFTSEGDVRLHISYLKHLNDPTPSHQLKFEIIDSGIGIPEDKVHLLFEEFSQIDASTTRQFGGTGLGLSISKKLTKMMKGEIGVESEFGKGSTFWFTAQFRASGCSLDI